MRGELLRHVLIDCRPSTIARKKNGERRICRCGRTLFDEWKTANVNGGYRFRLLSKRAGATCKRDQRQHSHRVTTPLNPPEMSAAVFASTRGNARPPGDAR